jgi:hypothetical protein
MLEVSSTFAVQTLHPVTPFTLADHCRASIFGSRLAPPGGDGAQQQPVDRKITHAVNALPSLLQLLLKLLELCMPTSSPLLCEPFHLFLAHAAVNQDADLVSSTSFQLSRDLIVLKTTPRCMNSLKSLLNVHGSGMARLGARQTSMLGPAWLLSCGGWQRLVLATLVLTAKATTGLNESTCE